MLLIYTQKVTPRIDYIFKQICTNILGIEITFTSEIETFISQNCPKISYGMFPLGTELFFESKKLLFERKIEPQNIEVQKWETTYGFFKTSNKSALPFDIFASAFYLITRYEEYLPYRPDKNGAFPFNQSLAYENNFLHQPIIDIWAEIFLNILLSAFPDLSYQKKKYQITPLVQAKQPFIYANQTVVNIVMGYIQDISLWKIKQSIIRSQTLLGFQPDPYDTFSWITQNTKLADKPTIVFFMLGDTEEISIRQNTHSLKFHQKIKFIGDYEEVGLMFSKQARFDDKAMKEEKNRMEAITHRPVKSTMFVDNNIKLPEVYRGLVQLEIEKDYSMVYNDAIGYRASTCSSFLFYDLEYEVKTPLTIAPVAISTQALKQYDTKKIEELLQKYYEQIIVLGGELNCLFSNQDFSLMHADNAPFWKNLFKTQLKL